MDITLKQEVSIYNIFWCPLIGHITRTEHMPAHIRMALTQVSLSIPVAKGKATLGIWQGIYLYEHRFAAMRRHVLLQVMGC